MKHIQKEVSLTLKGQLMPTTATRQISDFVDPGETPGNVAICISGGGSVSMMSTLGQLRALKQMGVLDKASCISTVSGGSWATVLFTFLPKGIADDDFLGTYVPNPGDLRMDGSNGVVNDLSAIGANYMGKVVAAQDISWNEMAEKAAELYADPNFNNYKIWNYLIAKNILAPFGLGGVGSSSSINKNWFAFNEAHRQAIIAENPSLASVDCYTYCQEVDGQNIKRPYHLCNTTMFVSPNDPNEPNLVASVQSTAIGTGIFASNVGTPGTQADTSLQQAGGGLVSSYAFNSQLNSVSGNDVEVNVEDGDLFSLTDITANSSAFYATMFSGLHGIDPKYNYWAVGDADASREAVLTPFADGGAIEDNGLLNALAYDDIDSAVVFVNALKSLSLDGDTVASDYSNVILDTWIPTYFGYTPYQMGKKAKDRGLSNGYHKFSDLSAEAFDSELRYLSKNQIFDSTDFTDFLKTIWTNSNGYTEASVFNKQMTVLDNEWFGITGRQINLLLIHYGPYKPFMNQLDESVKNNKEVVEYIQSNADTLNKTDQNPVHSLFPNYIILETSMPPVMLNLLAHFTCHVAMTQEEAIRSMFHPLQ